MPVAYNTERIVSILKDNGPMTRLELRGCLRSQATNESILVGIKRAVQKGAIKQEALRTKKYGVLFLDTHSRDDVIAGKVRAEIEMVSGQLLWENDSDKSGPLAQERCQKEPCKQSITATGTRRVTFGLGWNKKAGGQQTTRITGNGSPLNSRYLIAD